MNQNTKTCIEELKLIVMSLHRSASNLDSVISQIEYECKDRTTLSPDIKLMVAYQMDYRATFKHAYGDLDEREKEAWNKLIEALDAEK